MSFKNIDLECTWLGFSLVVGRFAEKSSTSVVNGPKKTIDPVFLIIDYFLMHISGTICPTKMVHLSKFAEFHDKFS